MEMRRPTKRQPLSSPSLRKQLTHRTHKLPNKHSTKDLSVSAEGDLDFRNLIQEIDNAMQRRLEGRMSLPGRSSLSPAQIPRENPWKDELYQFIAQLPDEKTPLTVQTVGRIDILSEGKTYKQAEMQTVTVGTETATVQTEDPAPLTTLVSFSPTESPEVAKKPLSRRKKSAGEPSRLRESDGLASIRRLLTSAPRSKPDKKPGEVLVTEDCPTVSLSTLFQTRKKALYMRMQARASTLSPRRYASPKGSH